MQAAPAQFATQTIRVQFDKDISFGNDVTVRIPKTGDLVNTMFLRVTWPSDLTSAVLQPSVGTAMLNRVELMYKDQVLERHYGETMNMLNEITVPQAKQSALTSLIGKGITSNLASYFIQMPFKTIPLVALDETPTLRIVFNTSNVFSNVTSYTGSVKLDLFVDYVYVSKAEREYMTSTPLSYFTQTFQLVRFRIPVSSYQSTYSLLTQFVNSVSELFWVIQADNASNVYDYTNTGGTDHLVSLRLTGDMNDLITPDYATPLYLRVIQGLEFHTRVPDSQFYMYSFAIAPEYEQATGTLNFSTFDTQQHDLTLTPSNYGREVRIYARSYNVFHVERGQGKVLFQAQEGGPVTGLINGVTTGQVFPAPANGVFSLFYTGTGTGGTTGALGGTSTVADASGSVYTCGTFSTATMAVYNKNGILFNTYTKSTGSTNTAYIVRYDQSGAAQWVVLMGGPGSSITNATALRIDSYGDLLVSGTFTAATTETITVYSGATAGVANAGTLFGTTFVTTAGTYDMFLMKLTTLAGTPQWALPIASPPLAVVYSFTATGVQNVPAGTYNYFLIGGGSGGSGGHTGGGGAGSISTGTFTYAGGNLSVTVGTGGTAGIGNNGVGGNGNPTTINTGANPTVAGGVGNNNGGSGSSGGGGGGNGGSGGAGGSNGSNGSPGAQGAFGTGQGTTLVTNARASLQTGLTLLYPTATATAGLGGAPGSSSHSGGGGGGGIVVTNVPSVTSPTAANGVNAISGRGGVGFGAAGGAGGYDGNYYNGGAGATGIAVIWLAGGAANGSEGADARLALPAYKNLLSLSSDLAGNVYVAFTSNSTAVTTSGVSRSTIGTTYNGSTSGVYSPHTYIAQFNKLGTFNWISGAAGSAPASGNLGNVFVTSIATSINGLTAMTGYFTSNLFSPFNSAGALSSGYQLTRSDTTSGLYPAPVDVTLPTVNSFVATYTSVGNIQMLAQQVSSNIQMLSVTYDATSNIITCGTVRGYGAVLYNTSAASAPPGLLGISSAFLCPTTTDTYGILNKYTLSGYTAWTIVIGGASGVTIPSACASDASSSVYACGMYTCPICTIGTASLTRLGTQDGFVVKYTSTSAYVWSVRIGSAGSTVACRSITIDPLTQNVIVSGTYTTTTNPVIVYTSSGVPSGITLPVTTTAMPFTIELKAT